MSRLFYHVMQDSLGNLLFDVTGTMRLAGSGTLATIYGDEALTVILPNPMTNHVSFGSFKCFLGAGDYDFYMAKAGYTFETLLGVQGHGSMAQQDAHNVTITGGSGIFTTVGVGITPIVPLDVSGDARITRLGVGRAPVAGHDIATLGNVLVGNYLGVAMSPAMPLDVNGDARITHLGLSRAPVAGHDLATLGHVLVGSYLGVGTSPTMPLDVVGDARMTRLGLNRAPVGGYDLATTGNVLVGAWLGVSTPPAAPLDVSGDARITRLGLNRMPLAGHDLATLGDAVIGNHLGVSAAAAPNIRLLVSFDKSNRYGIKLMQTANDTGPGQPILFHNTADGEVGSISTTASATAYNTSSDARLKEAVEPLDGALDVLRALNPVSFLWKADGSPGRGFLAHEVAEVVDGVITGEKDAVDEAGQVVPQQIDYSKLVPWLVAAVKELTEQVEMLTAKLAGAHA